MYEFRKKLEAIPKPRMRLAESDFVQSKACLRNECLLVFILDQNAALDDIWLSETHSRFWDSL